MRSKGGRIGLDRLHSKGVKPKMHFLASVIFSRRFRGVCNVIVLVGNILDPRY